MIVALKWTDSICRSRGLPLVRGLCELAAQPQARAEHLQREGPLSGGSGRGWIGLRRELRLALAPRSADAAGHGRGRRRRRRCAAAGGRGAADVGRAELPRVGGQAHRRSRGGGARGPPDMEGEALGSAPWRRRGRVAGSLGPRSQVLGQHAGSLGRPWPILVVSHYLMTRALLCTALGLSAREFRRFSIDNGEVIELDFTGDTGPCEGRPPAAAPLASRWRRLHPRASEWRSARAEAAEGAGRGCGSVPEVA
mmetsp:Transcript_171676/g.545287  ORF Transcript_171676/g.545287 Transcript_171676/m.545287 type:complete len:253 (+) Transcript_171676:163-921(+)